MAEVIKQTSAEAEKLLADLADGKKSISDLLGPLYGTRELTTEINIRPGTKDPIPSAPEAPASPVDDAANVTLVSNVHPPDYLNPTPLEEYDLVAVGAGVSGLLSVIIGNALGKKCALIERHYMGGDCLNVGCVPSKALLACAKKVSEMKDAADFGVILPPGEIKVDFAHVMRRMREIRAGISKHDSVERYGRDFCKHVFLGQAKFTGPNEIVVASETHGTRTLKFDKAMVATGASASIPPVPGLKDVPHLTNANFYNLTALPPRLVVIGAGPIGLEMAQSLARFGAKVTILEAMPQLLPREDPDAAKIIAAAMARDGIEIRLGAKIKSISYTGPAEAAAYCAPWGSYTITLLGEGVEGVGQQEEVLASDALLNATGRSPNVTGLGLEAAGVEYDTRKGVHIDDYFKTTAPGGNIYSCGDCATPYRFTHAADWQARVAVRNMFLGEGNRLSSLIIPWCTYCEPEVAHVGKYEYELDQKGVEYETYMRPLGAVDRCICEGVTEGFVKITAKKGSPDGEILGATIVGPNAGDMISELTVCMQHDVGCRTLAGTMHPYPTTQEAVRQCAAQFNKNLRTDAVNEVIEVLLARRGGKN